MTLLLCIWFVNLSTSECSNFCWVDCRMRDWRNDKSLDTLGRFDQSNKPEHCKFCGHLGNHIEYLFYTLRQTRNNSCGLSIIYVLCPFAKLVGVERFLVIPINVLTNYL